MTTKGRFNYAYLTNKSGGAVTKDQLVIVDAGNDSAFTTSTTAGDFRVIGVVEDASIANNALGLIRLLAGNIAEAVPTVGAVTRGNFVKQSTTAGKVVDTGTAIGAAVSAPVGSIGIALTGVGGAGNIVVWMFPALAVAGRAPDASIWLPDAPPASAGADDDEFADNSGGVPSGWTEVDHGTSLTVTEDEAGLKLTATAAQGYAGIYKAIPAGDFTIWTKISLNGIAESDFAAAGLVLWENAASSTGDLRVFNLTTSAAESVAEIQSWTAYNVYSSTLAGAAIAVDGAYPSHLFLRIRRTGTTYSFDVSTDGIGWLRLYSTAALGLAPAHYGPALNTFDFPAASHSARFPFFRYVASDVGIGGLMAGDRVNLFRA